MLDFPVEGLKGVGPKSLVAFKSLGIHTLKDMLFHLPQRYEDRTRITPIAVARPGDKVLLDVTVLSGSVQYAKRRFLLCRVSDESGECLLRFFHFSAAQIEQLTKAGQVLRCFGEIRAGFRGGLEMVHPEYRVKERANELALNDSLTPIYPTIKQLTQVTWRKCMHQALKALQLGKNSLTEYLPGFAIQPFDGLSLADALLFLHQPPPDVDLDSLQAGKSLAQQRLAFEELLAHQLAMQSLRQEWRQQQSPALSLKANGLVAGLRANLPFALTGAQERVAQELASDLAQTVPMLRLVQGDVGAGKTIIAALALAQALDHGQQAAFMAPTELLAEQHYRSLQAWFSPLGVTVTLLVGSLSEKQRREVYAGLRDGERQLVVGTHALFQEQVIFKSLGLLIIDEQHRFGVDQRLALKKKGENQVDTAHTVPHQLMMTATPIPRTLAMTAYADLDLSIIDELPPGRVPIQTVLISNERRDEMITRVAEHAESGRQTYWVCTSIEEREESDCLAVMVLYEELQQKLPQLRVGFVHGRLKASEKEAIMQAFRANDLQLLVATTVIEVGVDVPNSSLMIIENAERLGLAQLHQLRGRVGRGSHASYCVLLYKKPLSAVAARRLQVMRESCDGFYIAEEDLKIRGPGEVLGVRQTGLVQLKVADLLRDQGLLPLVKKAAQQLAQSPASTIEGLVQRWLAQKTHYAEV
jgi:ATP-dependent DNA helicase RecG